MLGPPSWNEEVETISLVSSMMTTSWPVSPLYLTISNVSLGLASASLLTYFQDCSRLFSRSGQDSPRPRYLSTLHLGLAALHLQLTPPDTRNKYYVMYWAIICQRPLMLRLVQKFPKSFSFGEAALLSQALLLTLTAAVMSLFSLDKISTRVLALELATKLRSLEEKFRPVKPVVFGLVSLWAGLVILSLALVALYNSQGWQVNTRTRKIFHAAIVMVYVSGLLWSPFLLLLSSYALLMVMLGLEILRVSHLFPPLSNFLTDKLRKFTDEKDGGVLILTNIYLLVGMSLPLWLDPGLTSHYDSQSAHFTLYTGLLSVGVFDTMAAVIGSSMGRIRWNLSSGRTLEGSLAGILSTLVTVFLLGKVEGVVLPSPTNVFISSCMVMMFEALSSQVDNLCLPLVMLISTNVCTLLSI